MIIKTSELKGEALDWAVAKAVGWKPIPVPPDCNGENGGAEVLAPPGTGDDWIFPPKGAISARYFLRQWSTDWSQGGPLIERYIRQMLRWADGEYEASVPTGACSVLEEQGPTPLIAAMRAIVAAELGDEVDVPDSLVMPA